MDTSDPEGTRATLEYLARRQFGGDPALIISIVRDSGGAWQVELRDRAGGWLMETIPGDKVLLSAASRQVLRTGDILIDT